MTNPARCMLPWHSGKGSRPSVRARPLARSEGRAAFLWNANRRRIGAIVGHSQPEIVELARKARWGSNGGGPCCPGRAARQARYPGRPGGRHTAALRSLTSSNLGSAAEIGRDPICTLALPVHVDAGLRNRQFYRCPCQLRVPAALSMKKPEDAAKSNRPEQTIRCREIARYPASLVGGKR